MQERRCESISRFPHVLFARALLQWLKWPTAMGCVEWQQQVVADETSCAAQCAVTTEL